MAREGNPNSIRFGIQWAVAEDQDQEKYQPLTSGILGIFVLVLSTALGISANILALKYFWTKRNVFFNALKMVALTDILICLFSTFYGLSLAGQREPLFFANQTFCWGWKISWEFFVKFSLHLVAIQSCLRTITICRPLWNLPNHILAVVVLFDFIVIVGFNILSGSFLTPVYSKSYASCMGRNVRPFKLVNNPISLMKSRSAIMFYSGLPYFVILLCCILCLIKLFTLNRAAVVRSRSRSLNRPRSSSRNLAHHCIHSIVSLLAFSLIGFVLNFLSFLPIMLRDLIFEGIKRDGGINVWFMVYGNLIFRQINITCNSVFNPFIFYWRMGEFRKYVWKTIFQPIYASYVQLRCKRAAFTSQIELMNMKRNTIDPQTNLHHATPNQTSTSIPNNLSRRHQIHDHHNSVKNCLPDEDRPLNTNLNLSRHDGIPCITPAVSWHGTVNRARNQETREMSDSEFGSIGTVIVHRNAINMDMCSHSHKESPNLD